METALAGAEDENPDIGLNGNPLNVAGMWRRFEEDIRTGRRSIPDFDAAVKLHQVLDTVEISSTNGRVISFPA